MTGSVGFAVLSHFRHRLPSRFAATMTNARTGYSASFLDVEIPLPEFTDELRPNVFTSSDAGFTGSAWAPYIHYSVATNKSLRQPICAALNIDFTQRFSGLDSKGWEIDSRVGKDFQLDNSYYRQNPIDRGHLARKAACGWGDNKNQADEASRDTYFYTNSSLQHMNLNQDEWLDLEDWVLNKLPGGEINRRSSSIGVITRASSFSGPIYSGEVSLKRFQTAPGNNFAAEIPTGFFKVVVCVDNAGELRTWAFIVLQDALALQDRRGTQSEFEAFQKYQVSLTEVQERTGLVFPSKMVEANPMFFGQSDSSDAAGVTELPEARPVQTSDDIIDNSTDMRTEVRQGKILILGALPNPTGQDLGAEWVVIANMSNSTVDLTDWTLSDSFREPLQINLENPILQPGETVRLDNLTGGVGQVILGNNGGSLSLFNQKRELVDSARYGLAQSGRVIVFPYQQ